jgi:hypothetical protein
MEASKYINRSFDSLKMELDLGISPLESFLTFFHKNNEFSLTLPEEERFAFIQSVEMKARTLVFMRRSFKADFEKAFKKFRATRPH